jgi:GTPase SAR1 family protein
MTDAQPNTLTQRLDEKVQEGLAVERSLLKRLRDLLVRQHFDDAVVDQVSGLERHLDELFLLVVVGEVKAGKSSFINSLLNAEVCKVGAIPTTDRIHVLKHGDKERERAVEEFLVEKYLPFEPLRNLSIVDTPGTNSIVKRHAEITEGFIPRCDLILFTTSVDRPFTETEREFLSYIVEGWSKKILFILAKKDIKEPHELEEIHGYVTDSVKKHFDFEPRIFIVSAKQAWEAKQTGNDALFEESGFKALEDYLFTELSESERLQLQLESPIDSARAICDRTLTELTHRMDHLKDDRKVLENIQGQLEQSESDMSENFGRYILEVENIVHEMERRGGNWLDDNVKITNIGLLRSAERFRARFKEEVIKDYEVKIDDTLSRAVDWFMKKYLKVWQDTTDYFSDQAARRPHDGMVGKVGRKFEYNREKIYDGVRADARDKVKNFNYDEQVRQFMSRSATGINTALGGSVIAAGGAIAVVALASGFTWIDITGILGALTLTGLSLTVLPMQRRKMKAEFAKKCTQLRKSLTDVLDAQIKAEARESIEKIRESFGPFFDYVGRTTGTVEEAVKEVKAIRDEFGELKRMFGITLKEEAQATPAPQPAPKPEPEPEPEPQKDTPED